MHLLNVLLRSLQSGDVTKLHKGSLTSLTRSGTAKLQTALNRARRDNFLVPKRLLPDVSVFEVGLKAFNPLLAAVGVATRLGSSKTLSHGRNRRINRYLLFQYLRLYKTRSNGKVYWAVAVQLISKSHSYLIACLHAVDKNLYLKLPKSSMDRLLKRINLMRSQELPTELKLTLRRGTGITLLHTMSSAFKYLRVYIPKGESSYRPLGVPTLSWRILANLWLLPINGFIIPDKNQHGFVPTRGTTTAWTNVLHNVVPSRNIWELDIKGFFPSVQIEETMEILSQLGQPDPVVDFLISMNKRGPELSSVDFSKLGKTDQVEGTTMSKIRGHNIWFTAPNLDASSEEKKHSPIKIFETPTDRPLSLGESEVNVILGGGIHFRSDGSSIHRVPNREELISFLTGTPSPSSFNPKSDPSTDAYQKAISQAEEVIFDPTYTPSDPFGIESAPDGQGVAWTVDPKTGRDFVYYFPLPREGEDLLFLQKANGKRQLSYIEYDPNLPKGKNFISYRAFYDVKPTITPESTSKDSLSPRVFTESAKSNPKEINTGFPQGSCLSPALSIIYLAEVLRHLNAKYPTVKWIFYADDGIFYGENDEEFALFLKDFDSFMSKYNLAVAHNKCQHTKSKNTWNVESFKFLGARYYWRTGELVSETRSGRTLPFVFGALESMRQFVSERAIQFPSKETATHLNMYRVFYAVMRENEDALHYLLQFNQSLNSRSQVHRIIDAIRGLSLTEADLAKFSPQTAKAVKGAARALNSRPHSSDYFLNNLITPELIGPDIIATLDMNPKGNLLESFRPDNPFLGLLMSRLYNGSLSIGAFNTKSGAQDFTLRYTTGSYGHLLASTLGPIMNQRNGSSIATYSLVRLSKHLGVEKRMPPKTYNQGWYVDLPYLPPVSPKENLKWFYFKFTAGWREFFGLTPRLQHPHSLSGGLAA